LRILIDFGDAPVFEAIAYASILLAVKHGAQREHLARVYTWNSGDHLSSIMVIVERKGFDLPQSKLAADGWQLEQPEVHTLLEKLSSKGTPLGKHVNGHFYRGMLTGLNEAFVIDEATKNRLISEDSKSAEIIKPFLRGKDVKKWRIQHKGLYLIAFPFGFHSALTDYPAILKHLERYESKLRKRGQCKSSRSGKPGGQHHWLELDNNPKKEYLNLHEQDKLIYPELASEPRFAFDDSGSFVDCTVYLVPFASPWLAAIMNSSVTTRFIRLISAVNRGGYLRFKKQYMQQIPVPIASDADKRKLSELGELCQEAAKVGDNARLKTLEAEIDQIVYRLFDLTPEEIALIENSRSVN
jgi:hypothetical protein